MQGSTQEPSGRSGISILCLAALKLRLFDSELTFPGRHAATERRLPIVRGKRLLDRALDALRNMHNTQVQEFADALSRGCEVVVVDPRFSTAAGKARYWLPIKP